MEIKLNDILGINDLNNVRIRLNLSNKSYDAIDRYHNDFKQMLIGNFHNSTNRIERDKEGNKIKNIKGRIWFKEGQIVVGLAQIKSDEWLLFDISRITRSYDKVWDGINPAGPNTFYEYERLDEYQKFCGRVIVKFHKHQAFVTLTGDKINNFILKEILPEKLLNDDTFPGYDNVNISWTTMKKGF